MKIIIQTIVGLAIVASMTGCSTPYMLNRAADARDIFTIGIEQDSIGFTAQAGPILTGLNLALGPESDCLGFGMRGGCLGTYKYYDLELIAGGMKFFQPVTNDRDKRFEATQFLFVNTGHGLFGDSNGSCYSFGNIEVSVSLGVGVRFGVNFLELLDFIIGWTTIDILNDDIATKKPEESNKVPVDTSRKLADPQH